MTTPHWYHTHSYLWMVRSQHQPTTEQEGNVQNTRTYDEPQDARSRYLQCQQKHVVLVKVAEESEKATPLTKDS